MWYKKNIFLLIWSLELIKPYHNLLHMCHISNWRPHHPDFEIFDGTRLTQPLTSYLDWNRAAHTPCGPAGRRPFELYREACETNFPSWHLPSQVQSRNYQKPGHFADHQRPCLKDGILSRCFINSMSEDLDLMAIENHVNLDLWDRICPLPYHVNLDLWDRICPLPLTPWNCKL